jgi:4,5-dihydroxyphthalate decarboxylase
MARLPLTLIFSLNNRVRPLLEGAVKPDGIDLTVSTASPAEIFWRQLHFAEFDVSEMSISSLLVVTARGDSPWVALPIFSTRRFFHTQVLVRADAGIERPEDLKGKRMGVPEYQQTGALWVRAALQHEFGVAPSDMAWYMERTPERSHGGATGFEPPPGVQFEYIPPEKNIASLMLAGELDANAFPILAADMTNRSDPDAWRSSRIRPLFRDPEAEGVRYFEKTGIFPMNHTVVVRRSVLEEHPWVALNLFNAFQTSKESVAARARDLADPYFRVGFLPLSARGGLDRDPFPYGVQANRSVLERLTQFSHEQGLTPRVVKLEELFAPSTLEL